MGGIPGEADILRVELQEARVALQQLSATLQAVAFQRRTYEEMLAATVRDLGEYKGDHTYVAVVTREGMAFSSAPFISDMVPDLALGGINIRFKGGPEVAKAAEEAEAAAQAAAGAEGSGLSLVGPDGPIPTKG